jgi:uncharacterized protein with PQ loop repeat
MKLDSTWNIFLFTFGLINSVITSIREIPQIVKIIRNQSGKDVSVWSISLIITYSSFWVGYGVLLENWILASTSIFMILSVTVILVLKLVYEKKNQNQDSILDLRSELFNLYQDKISKK